MTKDGESTMKNGFDSFAGFHLSGEIRPPKTPIPQGMLDIERKYKVSVSFDR